MLDISFHRGVATVPRRNFALLFKALERATVYGTKWSYNLCFAAEVYSSAAKLRAEGVRFAVEVRLCTAEM